MKIILIFLQMLHSQIKINDFPKIAIINLTLIFNGLKLYYYLQIRHYLFAKIICKFFY